MENMRCLTVGLSPAIQKTMILSRPDGEEAARSGEDDIRAGGRCMDVCRALVREEMDTVCLTVAGRDNWDTFRRLSIRDNLPLEVVPVRGKLPVVTTVVERESGRQWEAYSEEPCEISPEEESYFIDVFTEIMMEDFCGMIITGDRFPGFSIGIIPHMIRAGKEKGLVLFADYAGVDLANSLISDELRPDYVKISAEDFQKTFGSERPVRKAVRKLSRLYGNCFIVTEEDGSILIADRGRIYNGRADKGDIRPCGRDDSLIAGLARGIFAGRTLRETVNRNLRSA